MNTIKVELYWLEHGNWRSRAFHIYSIQRTMRYNEAIFVIHDRQKRPWYKVRIRISDYSYCLVTMHGELYVLTQDCSLIGKHGKIW